MRFLNSFEKNVFNGRAKLNQTLSIRFDFSFVGQSTPKPTFEYFHEIVVSTAGSLSWSSNIDLSQLPLIPSITIGLRLSIPMHWSTTRVNFPTTATYILPHPVELKSPSLVNIWFYREKKAKHWVKGVCLDQMAAWCVLETGDQFWSRRKKGSGTPHYFPSRHRQDTWVFIGVKSIRFHDSARLRSHTYAKLQHCRELSRNTTDTEIVDCLWYIFTSTTTDSLGFREFIYTKPRPAFNRLCLGGLSGG